ncbi:protoporphyrinogen oxidase [Marihabitans asiaticum]|uniref:Coproporphyrinogen III oxidase n=1 Tax=Marihabitans asiaticum TaxID=415218 RepID=A0A560W6S9_9MICO|nr:protoporphyrinogen oxidase [Marihabitans asiaticum]TWD13328.1 oxygen-dependent protoporphyrinogen oxidase [Marihabitans asiaticum]
MAEVVVIGAGIAGLTAAESLSRAGHHVTVLEGRDRVGGVIAATEVAGVRLDVGAESIRAGDSADEVLAAAGLTDRVVSPEPVPAQLWNRGALVALPARTFMGVPSDASSTAEVLTAEEVERAGEGGTPHLGDGSDREVSVAEAISAEYGRAVVDRLVEPLLGGVYAGRVDDLSFAATMGRLFDASRQHGSVRAGVRAVLPPSTPGNRPAVGAGAATGRRGPMLLGLEGGIWQLPLALAERVRHRGGEIRLRTLSRGVERTADGWRVLTGPTTDPTWVDADAVLVATGAPAAARLIRPHAPFAAAGLEEIETASMAVVTLAVPRGGQWTDLPGSGFLVPAVDGQVIKASTFVSTKWGWAAQRADEEGVLLLRASVGRAGDATSLQRDDDELVALALGDVAAALGRPVPELADAHVQRWGGGLPQYTVGHQGRVRRIREGLADVPGLAVAGASYDGVGIAGVLDSARTAARTLLDALAGEPHDARDDSRDNSKERQ